MWDDINIQVKNIEGSGGTPQNLEIGKSQLKLLKTRTNFSEKMLTETLQFDNKNATITIFGHSLNIIKKEQNDYLKVTV